ncbi:MAG TPA: hypothetical protein PLN95_02975 [Candidatus Saccharibacteria bacterium]|nr:hypothetical protein [Candidatus Saccharibacteria bacterium]
MLPRRRRIIPGETIPLERFSDELKARARMIGERALAAGRPLPVDVEQILAAQPADLRVWQLLDKFTYDDLDAIAEKLAKDL